MFKTSLLAQVEYFAKVGRMVAMKNHNRKSITPSQTPKNILCVVVNNTYNLYADIAVMTQKAWRANQVKLADVEYVCAVYNKAIVGVYKLENVEERADGRKWLDLELADLTHQQKYLGRKFNQLSVNGAVFYCSEQDF